MLKEIENTQLELEIAGTALNHILNSSNFSGSPQLCAFLTFVVEETLAGRGRNLKAYTIATKALGRPDSFDPITDATVRVIAGRVRTALELYYLKSDFDGDRVIELLPGSYIPHFRTRYPVKASKSNNIANRNSTVIWPKDHLGSQIISHKSITQSSQRLLILEDCDDIRSILRRVGHEAGFVVFETANANEFWLAYRSFRPTHIFLDMVLPGADGLAIMRELGRLSATCKITLISGIDPRVLRTAESLGREIGLSISGAINKPFNVDKLSEYLMKVETSNVTTAVQDIAKAIETQEITLYYQPKIAWDAEGKSYTEGVEALVRWNHPTRGILLPEIVIQAAEEAGVTINLTTKVIELAITKLEELTSHFSDIRISVNLSAEILYDLDFPDQLAAQMDEKGLSRDRLTLEISESIAGNEVLGPIDAIVRLGLKGFRLSMDDFGTGHFSLLRLLRMPFDELKLDKYIIGECKKTDEARTVVQTMIGLAKNLKLTACAVGVEDQTTFELLRSFGCNLVQGNHFSKPVKSEDLIDLIWSINKQQW